MWISKKKYEQLNCMATNNEHDAEMFRSLMRTIEAGVVVRHSEFIMMSIKAYEILFEKSWKAEDECKDLKAELEWYKVKYHEMKMKEDKALEVDYEAN